MTETTTYTSNSSNQYFLLRQKEGRVYSDKDVENLPEIDKEHKHYHEWLVRKDTSVRLVKYLLSKQRPFDILEVGCGNGWLSAKLSAILLSRVTGIDINAEELSQAKRIFSRFENIEFFNCSLQDEMFSDRRFDIIVFAASIQYFPSLNNILSKALDYLNPGGEIHIVDSNFYDQNEINAARQRSIDYYQSVGFPEMSDQYFHHLFDDLKLFNPDILYDPHSIINKLKKNKNPFYWVCIRNNA